MYFKNLNFLDSPSPLCPLAYSFWWVFCRPFSLDISCQSPEAGRYSSACWKSLCSGSCHWKKINALEGTMDDIREKFYSMPKLFGTPKMYQNGPQMSNYCAQLPPQTLSYINAKTSNPKISIWVHTRAKIHSFSKCQNSDHFWGCKKNILQIQPHHNETCL